MNANEMETAMRDSSDFLKAQAAFGHTDREPEVRSLCAQIGELRSLDKAGAAHLSRALATMDWEMPEQVQLAAAVRERSNKDSAASKKVTRARQTCKTFELYLKDSQWKTLTDLAVPMAVKIAIMRQLCVDLNLLLPSEPTKGRIAEVLHKCCMASDARDQCYGTAWKVLLDTVKSELTVLKKVSTKLPHLVVYPVEPNDLESLAPEIFAKLYAAEPPARRELSELQLTKGVRKTHKDFRPKDFMVHPSSERQTDTVAAMTHVFGFDPLAVRQPCTTLAIPQPAQPMVLGLSPAVLDQVQCHMRPMISQMIDQKLRPANSPNAAQVPASPFSEHGVSMALQGTRTIPVHPLDSTGPKHGPAHVPEESRDASREDGGEERAPTPPPEDYDDLDADEAAMRVALAARAEKLAAVKARKKPAACVASDADAVVAVVLKRPAAVLKSKSDPSLMSFKKPTKAPPPLLGPQGIPSVYYRGAKVSVSTTKGGYRVFCDPSQPNPSDVCIKWKSDSPANRATAWKAVLERIDSNRS
jgi:hypothetical protein